MNQFVTLGIDLGNTNSSLSYRFGEEPKPELVPMPEGEEKHRSLRNVMRTAVLYPFDGSAPIVGRRALRVAPTNGMRFVNFKESLLREENPTPQRERGIEKTALDALTDILRELKRAAQGHAPLSAYFQADETGNEIVPRKPLNLVVCKPSESSETYNNHLYTALVCSGWYANKEIAHDYCALLTEPIAVTLTRSQDARSENPDPCLIFDDGGLTLDLALLEPVERPLHPDERFQVTRTRRVQIDQARTGPCRQQDGCLDVGGSLLDKLVLQEVTRQIGGVNRLRELTRRVYGRDVDTAILQRLIAMEIRPEDPQVRSAEGVSETYQQLLFDVEDARILLSFEARKLMDYVEFRLGTTHPTLPPTDTGIQIDADMMKAILKPILTAIDTNIKELVGTRKPEIFMAGGCSLTPWIIEHLKPTYGNARVVVTDDYSPLESIAVGASRYNIPTSIYRRQNVDLPIETDYGVWLEKQGKYDVILKSGTLISATELPETGLPKAGQGIFEEYYSLRSKVVALKIGQRVRNGGDANGWKRLGELVVTLRSSDHDFRIYFMVHPKRQCLEVRLADTVTGELIPMQINTVRLS